MTQFFCKVLLLLSFLSESSGSSLRDTTVKDDGTGSELTSSDKQTSVTFTTSEWRKEPIVSYDKIHKRRSSSETVLFDSEKQLLEQSQYSDIEYRDQTDSQNTPVKNFQSMPVKVKGIHMSQESARTQNISSAYADATKKINAEHISIENNDKEKEFDNRPTDRPFQSVVTEADKVNEQNIHNNEQRSQVLESKIVNFRVSFPNSSSQASDVNSSIIIKYHSCCTISNTIANCTGCQLKYVPTYLPSNISKLLLDKNNISSEALHSGVFARYTELIELNLDSNNITILGEGTFQGLEHLEILRMYNNRITLDMDFNNSTAFYPLNNTLETLIINRNTNDSGRALLVYPDQALSVLSNLSTLHIDGLNNNDFGIGFLNLRKLTKLLMAGYTDGFCNMYSISGSMFLNLPYLKMLNISDCNIYGPRVNSTAFSHLTRLQMLDVSNNFVLGIKAVETFMYGLKNNTNFVHLKMDRIVARFEPCIVIYKRTLTYFKYTGLQVIEARNNEIEMIEEGALEMLPSTLKMVNLTNNRIMFGAYWKDMAFLTNLEGLYLDSSINLVRFPMVFPPRNLRCPESKYLSTPSSDHTYVKKCICGPGTCLPEKEEFILPVPPKLQNFTMHKNALAYNINSLKFCPTNNLTMVDLSDNVFQILEGPITGLNKLQHLKLSSCFIQTIEDTFFDNLTSLQSLDLYQNLLDDCLNNDVDGKIFDKLNQLKLLNISFNNLYILNKQAFKDLNDLEILDLSTNRLAHANFGVDHMKKLTFLDLHKNDISSLPQALMDLVDNRLRENVTIRIDMRQNPIKCDCSNLAFLEWVISRQVFWGNNSYYYCKYPMEDQSAVPMAQGYTEEVKRLRRECSTHVDLFVGVAGGTLCVAAFIIGLLLYRFRWTLRYWFHAAKLKVYSNEVQVSQEYEYDVFVSYASQDVEFVITELSNNLSAKRHLKLMVHGETFQAGRHIADNIYTAVRQSRKTLVLVTKHLLTSHWCTYELQMARMESISTGRNVLVFLFLEDIPANMVNIDVKSYIKTSTYIMYPKEITHREAFWNKLADDLRAP